MKKTVYSLVVLVFTLCSASLSSQVVINEISYNALTPNSPGKQGGVEYLELYNDGTGPVNLIGWEIPRTANNGINYTFGNVTINAGEYLLLTNDSVGFFDLYNKSVLEYTGFILNGGYRLELLDSAGNKEDSVRYDDNAPWPTLADGQGCSIELCDPTSDNADAANWRRATNYFGVYNRRKIYGTPGAMNSTCSSTPIIQVLFRSSTHDENDGALTFDVYIDNTNGAASSVEVEAFNGTGDVATDVVFSSPTAISFTGNQDETMPFTLTIVDDTLDEPEENLWLVLKNPANASLANDTLEIIINKDNFDIVLTRQLKLAGILNIGEQNPAPNLIEIIPLSDIADLSTYSLGCANNGGGTDGVEFQFPAVSVKRGQSYFVTRQPDAFKTFFGFEADFLDTLAGRGTTTATNFTGDDALELFEYGRVIDHYGEANVDGTGEVWEYLNSWAKRKKDTGPDGDGFVATNWTYGGFDALDDTLSNDSCSNPYPFPKKQVEGPGSVFNSKFGQNNYSVYPNPSGNFLKVSGLGSANQLKVIDLIGNVVLDVKDTQNEVELDLTEIESGVYFLQILDENSQSSAIKFIKTE
ncbi:MAG: hypothetical protein CL842_13345 [Crocinitomicaceae bacterium]|nr:hypothetical protein [Crocinitomicaceae bacterium]|tara:strand:+ start:16985 stop:18736 length:1752 start_codon:yes stop_codon:yes gene_type:complete